MACATCDVARHYAALDEDPDCVKAWTLWRTLASGFVFEGHALGVVFERLTRDYAPDEYEDMLKRMAILYETFCPPPERPDGA